MFTDNYPIYGKLRRKAQVATRLRILTFVTHTSVRPYHRLCATVSTVNKFRGTR